MKETDEQPKEEDIWKSLSSFLYHNDFSMTDVFEKEKKNVVGDWSHSFFH